MEASAAERWDKRAKNEKEYRQYSLKNDHYSSLQPV